MNDVLKAVFQMILFTVLFLLVAYVWFSPDFANLIGKKTKYEWDYVSLDLKKFNQTPEYYLNKSLTVKGEFEQYSNAYVNCPVSVNRLKDKEGYFIRICAVNLNFEAGETYTLKGKVVLDTSKSTGKEYYILMAE
jgi:hypothetical protein